MVVGQNLVPVSRSWRIVVATRLGDGGIFSSLAETEPTPQTLLQQYRPIAVLAKRGAPPSGEFGKINRCYGRLSGLRAQALPSAPFRIPCRSRSIAEPSRG